MKKKITAALLALSLLMMTGCASEEEPTIPAGTAVETKIVTTGEIIQKSEVTGNVMASQNVPVMVMTAGSVDKVYVEAGDTVEKGDVLFTMDTEDLRDTYGTGLDTYYSTKKLLDEQVRLAQESLDKLQVLYDMGAVSKDTLEQTELSVLQAETSRETTLAQMGLDEVLDLLNDPNVTAPISGTVTSISAAEGSMVSSSNPAVVISSLENPQAVVNVSETLLPYLAVGQEVPVTIPSLGSEPVTATIAGVASAPSQSTALYPVTLNLPAEVEATIGMFVTASFTTNHRTDVVLVPTETIQEEDGKQYLYIVEGDTARKVEVTTGIQNETDTEITSGLTGGETLVTRGQTYLKDGALVRVVEE